MREIHDLLNTLGEEQTITARKTALNDGRGGEGWNEQTGINKLLKSRGIGDNDIIASMLIQQAERWHVVGLLYSYV